MTVEQLAPGVHQISLGMVNAYLLEWKGALTLIDTGVPNSGDKILQAVGSLGKSPQDIRHIIVTHCHADHAGSLASLKRQIDAPAYMHPLDAVLVRQGIPARPVRAAPGIKNWLIYNLVMRPLQSRIKLEAAEVELEIGDGDILDFAGGLQAIHVPGHSAGQLAFLRPNDSGLLFAADAASGGFGYPPIFEDFTAGKQSLQKLASLPFDIACFGHGSPIRQNARARLEEKLHQET